MVSFIIKGENNSVISELLNSIATVYQWNDFFKPEFRKTIHVPMDTLVQYIGNFQVMKDTLTLLMCGDKLCIQQNGQPAGGYQLFFSDNRHFSLRKVPSATFTVLYNETGEVEALELLQQGMKLRLPKVN